jgi:hypothetical protein
MPFEIISVNFNDDTVCFQPRVCIHNKTLPISKLLNKEGHRYCGLCYEPHGIATFNNIVKCVKEKECTLLTTKEHFMELNMNSFSKIRIIGKCKHEFEMMYWTFKDSTALCPLCINIHRSNIRKAFYADNKNYEQNVELNGNDLFRKFLSKDFEIERVSSCLADMIIKPKEIKNDLWLPIQLKATIKKDSRHVYKFDIKKNDYTNTVLVCICISESKFWIFEGINIPKTDFINIFSKTEDSKSLHNGSLVLNNDLVSHMKKLYEKSQINNSKNILAIPQSPKHKLEYKYKLIREEKFKNILDFKYQECDSFVYDFIVNKLKVQEKVSFPEIYNPSAFRVNIRKTKKKKSKMPYHENDNDIYWFHIVNTTIFYVIPNKILVNIWMNF